MNDLLKAALEYRRLGFSVIPVRSNKRGMRYWSKYQYTHMSEPDVIRAFNWSSTKGLAIVCGDISGHLEVIDIDSKNDLSDTLFHQFSELLEQQLPGFIYKAPLARTRNNGYHVFYRCLQVGRNTVLARRRATAFEQDKVKVLMETRGNGGYVVVTPSPGYIFLQGHLSDLPVIQSVERDILFSVARLFNSYTEIKYQRKLNLVTYTRASSPLLDYDKRGDVVSLLEKHGWTVVRKSSNRTYFKRPGQSDHETSGDFHHGLNLFGVFSNSTVFTERVGYSPSAVYAILECGGNYSLAAKKLINAGYGIPYKKRIL